jgi:hypothetical protein
MVRRQGESGPLRLGSFVSGGKRHSRKTKLNPNGGYWPGKLLEYFFFVPPRPGVDVEIIDSDISLVPHY